MSLNRFDFDVITRWIRPQETVLDLGCGDGALLKYLTAARQVCGYGIENDINNVKLCLKNGVNVLHLDLEQGLAGFDDGAFDHVIMSLSLQAMRNTQQIVQEMLRVGDEVVVSFPNFGYWRHRKAILNGHMPVSESLPHQWFNTPNVRFFTLADFEALCASHQIEIRERLALDGERVITDDPNFLASTAMYRLGRL